MSSRDTDKIETPDDDLTKSFLSIFPVNSRPEKRDEFKMSQARKSKKHSQDDLFYEQVEEQKQRRWFRWIMFILFFLLLLAQHGLIAWFIYCMILRDLISNVQPLLAVIIPATLGETYAIINVMVKFIFSPGNFEHNNKSKQC